MDSCKKTKKVKSIRQKWSIYITEGTVTENRIKNAEIRRIVAVLAVQEIIYDWKVKSEMELENGGKWKKCGQLKRQRWFLEETS